MTYHYPTMAYRMPDLEGRLTPPTGLGGLLSDIVGGVTNVLGGGAGAIVTGLTALQKQGWCSTGNPSSGCKPIAGICVPTVSTYLESFKDLQRQTNRLLAKAGKPPIGVDGRIGPGTVGGVADAMTWAGSMAATPEARAMGLAWANVRGKPCDLVAAHASEIAGKMRDIANLTAAPMVADPVTSKPSQPAAGGGVVHPPVDVIQQSAQGSGLFGFIPPQIKTPLGIAALVVGGLLIRKAMKSPGGRKGKAGRGRARGGRARARRRSRR